MTMSDPIADMLTRIRNANTAKHDTVDIPSSKIKVAIADILVNEGFIEKYEIVEDGNFKSIRVTLKYGADKNEKIITGIKRISKPGLRVYAGKDNLPEGYSLSAVSVYNLLKKASIRSFYHSFPTSSSAIHVQLDEKYIHMRNARKKAGKQRLYTATIFSGIFHNKKQNMLKNRMIISSRNLTTLFNKINYFLKYIYNVSLDSHIFISGDLAIYIQISPDRITVCP